MELRIAVVDDLATDRAVLVDGLSSYEAAHPGLRLVATQYTDAAALLGDSARDTYDLVFLDIYMGEMSGIELARNLRISYPRLLIVFCTTSLDHTFDALPLHPFDYLVKPYETARLHAMLDEVVRVLGTPEPTVEVRVPRSTRQVPLSKIVAAESNGHNTDLRMTDGYVLRCSMTFAQMSDLLLSYKRFLLVNRGCIINMDEVHTHNGEEFSMNDGHRYLMRTRGRAKLLQDFSHYMLMRMSEVTRP